MSNIVVIVLIIFATPILCEIIEHRNYNNEQRSLLNLKAICDDNLTDIISAGCNKQWEEACQNEDVLFACKFVNFLIFGLLNTLNILFLQQENQQYRYLKIYQ